MNRIQTVAAVVASVALIASAILASLYLFEISRGATRPDLVAPQNGFAVTDAPGRPGGDTPKEAIVAPAAEAPSFA